MDYSPPGSSVNEILQARILELVAISFSKRKISVYQKNDFKYKRNTKDVWVY